MVLLSETSATWKLQCENQKGYLRTTTLKNRPRSCNKQDEEIFKGVENHTSEVPDVHFNKGGGRSNDYKDINLGRKRRAHKI